MFSPTLLWTILIAGVLLAVIALRSKYGWKVKGSSALFLAAVMLYGATTTEAGPRRRAARYQAYQATVTQQTQMTQNPAAATAPCVCPQGACCNGACANCPAGTGWKCGPNGCVPPASNKTIERTKTRSVTAAAFEVFTPVEASTTAPTPPAALPAVWSPMPDPGPVAATSTAPVEWTAFGS